jgi:outer membrane biosynthesis protein TonB
VNSPRAVRLLAWALGLGACIAAIYVAAGAALERPDLLRIEAAMATGSGADYSADERQVVLPPLDPQIIDAIASDEAALARAEDGLAPIAPTPTPRRAAPTRTPTRTPEPVPTDTPVPEPTATRTPEPEPTATDTPEPTATDTPDPTPTATDTPEPTPSATATPARCPTPETAKGSKGSNGKKKRCPTPTNTPKPTATALADGEG